MTYQVTLCGVDGVVTASDQRELRSPGSGDEGQGPTTNLLPKIRIGVAGKVSWTFSGGEISAVAAEYLAQDLSGLDQLSIEEARSRMRETGNRAWQNFSRGPSNSAAVVMVFGETRTMLRACLSPSTVVEEMKGPMLFAGQIYSVASFIPQHFFSHDLTVDSLAGLAAYTVRMANAIDPFYVAGLDVAIYRDSTRRFEFGDSSFYWELAGRLDESIRDALLSP